MPRRSLKNVGGHFKIKQQGNRITMFFVYSLQSTLDQNRYYIGLTLDVNKRLEEHNAGRSIHTNKHRPWVLVCYVAFSSKSKAAEFERYLKSCSGRAFCKKHF